MADKVSAKTRKELREPDQFHSFTQRVVEWISAKSKVLIGAGVVIVAAILGFYGWQWHLESATQEASAAFVDAKKALDAPVRPQDGAEGTSQADGSYTSAEDKYRAALTGLEQVKANYSASSTASLATYFIGESHWQLDEYDLAIAAFESYLKTEGAEGELAPFAVEGIAATLEDKGDFDQAKLHYKRLTEPPFESQRARGLYHLARMEQKLGNAEQAARLFNGLLEEFPDTGFGREIQERLAVLPKVETPRAEAEPEAGGDAEAAGGAPAGQDG